MYPVLLELGALKIPTYGVLMALGFLISFNLVIYRAQKQQLDVDGITNLLFIVLVSSIGGSRFLYVALRWEFFLAHPLDAFKLWRGGLVFIGGLIAALIFSLYYCHKRKLPLLVISDLIAPFLALGHVFGRLGCFCYGCCYGRPTGFFTGVHFPNDAVGIYRHPTQLYEAAAELGIFLFLNWLYIRKYQQRKSAPQSLLATYVLLYSIFRFFNEFLRGDNRGGAAFFGLSVSQNGTMILALVAVASLVIQHYKDKD